MIRLQSSNAAFTSDVWEPAGETLLQIKADSSAPSVDVEARVQADAPWQVIDTLHKVSRPIVRLAQMPFLRLTLKGNGAGEAVSVWDSE